MFDETVIMVNPQKISSPVGWQSRMGLGWLYRLMDIPWIYKMVQALLAPGAQHLLQESKKDIFGKTKGLILDIGCGPRVSLPLPGVTRVGIDINESYLRAYTGGVINDDPRLPFRKNKPTRRFGYLADAQSLPFTDRSFDEAHAIGFFHHLDSMAVQRSLLEMRRCVKPGGRLILFEPIWPTHAWSRSFAWLTLQLDRGRYMRTEKEFRDLLIRTLGKKWEFRRMTYTYTGLECVWAVYSRI